MIPLVLIITFIFTSKNSNEQIISMNTCCKHKSKRRLTLMKECLSVRKPGPEVIKNFHAQPS